MSSYAVSNVLFFDKRLDKNAAKVYAIIAYHHSDDPRIKSLNRGP